MKSVVVKILGHDVHFVPPCFGDAEELFDDATKEDAHWPSITKKAVKLSACDAEGNRLFSKPDLGADLGMRILLEGGQYALAACGLIPEKKASAKAPD